MRAEARPRAGSRGWPSNKVLSPFIGSAPTTFCRLMCTSDSRSIVSALMGCSFGMVFWAVWYSEGASVAISIYYAMT